MQHVVSTGCCRCSPRSGPFKSKAQARGRTAVRGATPLMQHEMNSTAQVTTPPRSAMESTQMRRGFLSLAPTVSEIHSKHPYDNNADEWGLVLFPPAVMSVCVRIAISFDPKTRTESKRWQFNFPPPKPNLKPRTSHPKLHPHHLTLLQRLHPVLRRCNHAAPQSPVLWQVTSTCRHLWAVNCINTRQLHRALLCASAPPMMQFAGAHAQISLASTAFRLLKYLALLSGVFCA